MRASSTQAISRQESLRDTASYIDTLGRELRRWLTGRLQSPSGAFYAWRDAESATPAFEYPEITGYVLTYLAGLLDPTDTEVDIGRRAGRWLVSWLADGERAAHSTWDHGTVYNFDLAMIAAGLLSFGLRWDDDSMVGNGLWLVEELRSLIAADRRLAAFRRSGSPGSSRWCWSSHGQAHLLKIVQCLLVTDTLVGGGCSEAAESLVNTLRRLQREDGRFITHRSDGEIMLHPHLYAVEGLWIYGSATGDWWALEGARLGTRWAWHHQLPSGGFPRSAQGHGPPVEQTDVTAQAVRAALLVRSETEGLDRALRRLADVAVTDDPYGMALPYQPGAVPRHLNAAATLFGAQALGLATPDRPPPRWTDLV